MSARTPFFDELAKPLPMAAMWNYRAGWHMWCEADKKWISLSIRGLIGNLFFLKCWHTFWLRTQKEFLNIASLVLNYGFNLRGANLPIARTWYRPPLCHPVLVLTASNFYFKCLRYNQQLTTRKNAHKFRFWSNFYQFEIFVSNALCHPVLVLAALNFQIMLRRYNKQLTA